MNALQGNRAGTPGRAGSLTKKPPQNSIQANSVPQGPNGKVRNDGYPAEEHELQPYRYV